VRGGPAAVLRGVREAEEPRGHDQRAFDHFGGYSVVDDAKESGGPAGVVDRARKVRERALLVSVIPRSDRTSTPGGFPASPNGRAESVVTVAPNASRTL